ncbi:MAG: class I SAM-dependent methyltransferase [bacterium]
MYRWLRVSPTGDGYIEPDYYDQLLRKYIFDGKEDTEYFREHLAKAPSHSAFLELGPGTGRATNILFASVPDIHSLTLVDLSSRMLSSCKQVFTRKECISYVVSDSIDFLLSVQSSYDYIYSLWSLSHSIHKNLEDLGKEDGKAKVREALLKMVRENLNRNGSLFLIHFDSSSPEQEISIRQRRRDSRDRKLFADVSKQSPSKEILDECLEELRRSGEICFECERHVGTALEFSSLDEALEYYLNFHMASYFNTSSSIDDILKELSQDLLEHQGSDGKIRIVPGCFIYKASKPG